LGIAGLPATPLGAHIRDVLMGKSILFMSRLYPRNDKSSSASCGKDAGGGEHDVENLAWISRERSFYGQLNLNVLYLSRFHRKKVPPSYNFQISTYSF